MHTAQLGAASELCDEAAGSNGNLLIARPLLRASVNVAHGELLLEQGEFSRARQCFADAYEAADQSDHQLNKALTLNAMASLELLSGHDDKAFTCWSNAVKLFEAVLAAAHPSVAECLLNLALIHVLRADFASATQVLSTVRAYRDPLMLVGKRWLLHLVEAQLHLAHSRFGLAANGCADALARLEQANSADGWEKSRIRLCSAMVDIFQGNGHKSLESLATVNSWYRRSSTAAVHPLSVALTIEVLRQHVVSANFHAARATLDEYQRQKSMLLSAREVLNPKIEWQSLYLTAAMHFGCSAFAQARELIQRVVDDAPDSCSLLETARASCLLSACMIKLAELSAAKRTLSLCKEQLNRVFGTDGNTAAFTAMFIPPPSVVESLIALHEEDLIGAYRISREAVAVKTEAWGDGSVWLLPDLIQLAEASIAFNDCDSAAACTQLALDLAAQSSLLCEGMQHAHALYLRGHLLMEQARFADADELLESALEVSARIIGTTEPHELLFQIYEVRARALHRRGEYAKAQAHFEQSVALALALYGEAHPATARTRYHLARLLLEQRQPTAEAALAQCAKALDSIEMRCTVLRVSINCSRMWLEHDRDEFGRVEHTLLDGLAVRRSLYGENDASQLAECACLAHHYMKVYQVSKAAEYLDIGIALFSKMERSEQGVVVMRSSASSTAARASPLRTRTPTSRPPLAVDTALDGIRCLLIATKIHFEFGRVDGPPRALQHGHGTARHSTAGLGGLVWG